VAEAKHLIDVDSVVLNHRGQVASDSGAQVRKVPRVGVVVINDDHVRTCHTINVLDRSAIVALRIRASLGRDPAGCRPVEEFAVNPEGVQQLFVAMMAIGVVANILALTVSVTDPRSNRFHSYATPARLSVVGFVLFALGYALSKFV
jgi:hypothetical protein